jgi:hypothetical protein
MYMKYCGKCLLKKPIEEFTISLGWRKFKKDNKLIKKQIEWVLVPMVL